MWNDGLKWLMGKGSFDSMLGGYTTFHNKQKEMLSASLYGDKWHQQIKEFYEYITLKLLTENSCKIAGMSQVDITREYVSMFTGISLMLISEAWAILRLSILQPRFSRSP